MDPDTAVPPSPAAQVPRLSPVATASAAPRSSAEVVYDIADLDFYYGDHRALHDVSLQVFAKEVTAFIGPSGCGKTTFLRCLNRMNDLIADTRVDGRITFRGGDLYAATVKPIELRRRVGMVFQKPNPFPKSIYDNVAFAPRANGVAKKDLEGVVESALRSAAVWDEVKDKLRDSAFDLSGGQQQRLCIARAIAVEPEVILMDEPCSALDPIATGKIEELLASLKERFTIAIVTHNLQQAARVADRTAFFTAGEGGGELVEIDDSTTIFSNPSDRRTEDYITGRFG